MPDRKRQYQDGYSMAEAAKCWVAAGDCLPSTIAAVIGGNELNSAHFEYPTTVWGGGTAMTDIMAFLPNGVVAVEAKLNEPFDVIVSDWIDKKAAPIAGPRFSRMPAGPVASTFASLPRRRAPIGT